MDLEGKLFDFCGNEIELKPGHVLVIGKESFCQIPINTHEQDYDAKIIYKEPTASEIDKCRHLLSEWHGTARCRTSDGREVNMTEELNRLEGNNEKILETRQRIIKEFV